MHWQSLGICCQQWEPKADRQTDRTARTPSVPATPSLTHGAFGNQQGRSCAPWRTTTRIDPPAAAHSPGAFQASIPRVFRTRWGGDRRRSGRCGSAPTPALPGHNHRLPEPERNLGGGRGRSCRERIQPTAGTGRASKTPKSPAWHPKPSSPWLLQAPGARGIFFPSWEENPCGIATTTTASPKGSRDRI